MRLDNRTVLVHHEPGDEAEFLLWPVLVYRVTAPTQVIRKIDIFERVILALCEAGVRRSDSLADHTGLHIELCEHIVEQMIDSGRLTGARELTAAGRQVHRSGQLAETPELLVTHVFQDAFSGELWPRSARELYFRPVEAERDGLMSVRLGRRGAPRVIAATVVHCAKPVTWPPRPEAVINAIARHRVTATKHRGEKAQGELPDLFGVHAEEELSEVERFEYLPEVHRVVDIGEPRLEYLLCSLNVSGSLVGGEDPPDPFGLGRSPMLRQLLRVRSSSDERFASWLADVRSEEAMRLQERLRAASLDWADHVEADLVHRLGEGLFTHPQTFDLLKNVHEQAGRNDSASAAEAVRREAYRLYEYLLRRFIAVLPPPVEWSGRPAGELRRDVRGQFEKVVKSQAWEVLIELATDLGFNHLPVEYKGSVTTLLSGPPKIGDSTKVWELLCWAIVSAADPLSPHVSGHPLRDLAKQCPNLPTDLVALGKLRNSGSHADRDLAAIGSTEWSVSLAMEAARAALQLPPEIY
ncbi:hypothetical protein GCM10027200_52040 [Lentzea nigeriaca]